MTHFYITGYSTNEDNVEYVLLHDQKFSAEEFSHMLAVASYQAVAHWLDAPIESEEIEENSLEHPFYWLADIPPQEPIHNFTDVTSAAVKWLVTYEGFRLLQPALVSKFSGWARLTTNSQGFSLSPNTYNSRAVSLLDGLEDKIFDKNRRIMAFDESLDPDEEWGYECDPGEEE